MIKCSLKTASLAIAALLLVSSPALAEPPPAREKLVQMFSQIAQNTDWDLSRAMLWGYFFTNPTRAQLDTAAKELAGRGYQVVKVYQGDKENPNEPDKWWLHVERIEPHSVDSLLARNAELEAFAKQAGLASYDGMDVGPAPAKAK